MINYIFIVKLWQHHLFLYFLSTNIYLLGIIPDTRDSMAEKQLSLASHGTYISVAANKYSSKMWKFSTCSSQTLSLMSHCTYNNYKITFKKCSYSRSCHLGYNWWPKFYKNPINYKPVSIVGCRLHSHQNAWGFLSPQNSLSVPHCGAFCCLYHELTLQLSFLNSTSHSLQLSSLSHLLWEVFIISKAGLGFSIETPLNSPFHHGSYVVMQLFAFWSFRMYLVHHHIPSE